MKTTTLKIKLYDLLTRSHASRRLLHSLWRYPKAFTVGRDITVAEFIQNWPPTRLQSDLFGFGPAMRKELLKHLTQMADIVFWNPATRAAKRWAKERQPLVAYCHTFENPKLGPVATAKRIVAAIEELRAPAGSGNSVDILCVNDEPPPNEAIICAGDWTGYAEQRFEGDTLLDCLTKAVAAKRKVAK